MKGEFRGKSTIDGKWEYGYLIYSEQEDKYYIGVTELMTPVDPDTIGRMTGLLDKNGNKIFEGDKVLCSYFRMGLGENLGVIELEEELKGVIFFDELSLVVANIESGKWSDYTGYKDSEGSCKFTYLHDVYEGSQDAEMSIEIIGNIHE